MAKNAKRKSLKKACSAPKGQPQKAQTLKEALQNALSKETSIKDAQGKIQKISCLEALATSIVADAIANDGPTRRMLLREDILNLPSKEPEIELPPDEAKIKEVEKVYGNTIRNWVSADPKIMDVMSRLMQSVLVDVINEKSIEGE